MLESVTMAWILTRISELSDIFNARKTQFTFISKPWEKLDLISAETGAGV